MYTPSHEAGKEVLFRITIVGCWRQLSISGWQSDVYLYCKCLLSNVLDAEGLNWDQRLSNDPEKYSCKTTSVVPTCSSERMSNKVSPTAVR